MVGKYKVIIQDSIVKYEFTLYRNITFIRGDSGTGKSVLCDLINNYYDANRDGFNDSGISISSEVPVYNYTDTLDDLDYFLRKREDSIVLFDEDCTYVKSDDFVRILKKHSIYIVIINRMTYMIGAFSFKTIYSNLPFSVNSIYEFISIPNDDNIVFNTLHRLGRITYKNISINKIYTEDEGSGNQWVSYVTGKYVNSCGGNGNANKLFSLKTIDNILIIIDGAAFGPYCEELSLRLKYTKNVTVWAPESFEHTLAASGIIGVKNWDKIGTAPYDYIDSKIYLSWERYFYKLVADACHSYNKSRMPKFLMTEENKGKYLNWLPKEIKSLLKDFMNKDDTEQNG